MGSFADTRLALNVIASFSHSFLLSIHSFIALKETYDCLIGRMFYNRCWHSAGHKAGKVSTFTHLSPEGVITIKLVIKQMNSSTIMNYRDCVTSQYEVPKLFGGQTPQSFSYTFESKGEVVPVNKTHTCPRPESGSGSGSRWSSRKQVA